MQSQLDVTLSGFQRFVLVKHWNKLGKPGNKEEWIKKACEQKGIIYSKPIQPTR